MDVNSNWISFYNYLCSLEDSSELLTEAWYLSMVDVHDSAFAPTVSPVAVSGQMNMWMFSIVQMVWDGCRTVGDARQYMENYRDKQEGNDESSLQP